MIEISEVFTTPTSQILFALCISAITVVIFIYINSRDKKCRQKMTAEDTQRELEELRNELEKW